MSHPELVIPSQAGGDAGDDLPVNETPNPADSAGTGSVPMIAP